MAKLLIVLELLGALGVFLMGMKLMSEALQKVAGARLKSLLAKMTGNRFSAVLTGLAVTGVVQSSSATTVMVVSFTAAGLFTLTQAIGVIMGANIGTTLTGWIVALLGFKIKVTSFALPAVAFGLLLSLPRGAKRRQWGEVLMGFGLLFLGLGLMKDSVPGISNPEQLAWIQSLTEHGFLSLLIFVALGTVLTVVLQSSSATMTLTLTLAALGWLPYPMAAATVLGENIGTTATANLAAIGAPIEARRAARVHLLFNVFGVLWALALMKIYWLPLTDLLVPGDPLVDFTAIQSDAGARAAAATVVTTHLAAAHTLFNVTNTAVMLPFVAQLEAVVMRWLPGRDKPRRGAAFLGDPMIQTPELSLLQASRAMQSMTDVVREMFRDSVHIITHPEQKLGSLVEDTLEREDELDDMERDIGAFLALVTRSGTSTELTRRVAAMLHNAHRLERIGDHCAVLVRIARRLREAGSPFSAATISDLETLAGLVDRSLEGLGHYLVDQGDPTLAEQIEDEIDETRRRLRARYIHWMESAPEDLTPGLAFLDTITHLEEIGDRAIGVIRQAEALREG